MSANAGLSNPRPADQEGRRKRKRLLLLLRALLYNCAVAIGLLVFEYCVISEEPMTYVAGESNSNYVSGVWPAACVRDAGRLNTDFCKGDVVVPRPDRYAGRLKSQNCAGFVRQNPPS